MWCLRILCLVPSHKDFLLHFFPESVHFNLWTNLSSFLWKVEVLCIFLCYWKDYSFLHWIAFALQSKSPRTSIANIWGQEKMAVSAQAEDSSSPFFYLFVLSGPQGIGWCPPMLGRATWARSSPNQMLTSSGNTLTDTTPEIFSPAIWASLSPVRSSHKNDRHVHLLPVPPVFPRRLIQFLKSPRFSSSERVCGKVREMGFPLSERSLSSFFSCHKVL